jgi:hypothetical protein
MIHFKPIEQMLPRLRRYFFSCSLIFFLFVSAGCNQGSYTTVKHVKPVNRNRYYNPKKDKQKKRVKYTKKKILKRSPKTPTAPSRKKKPPKEPKQRQDTVQYESDSTGFL